MQKLQRELQRKVHMELFYPSKNLLEIRKPFPILARHAGKVLILFSGLFGAVGMVTGSGDIPVLVHVLSIVGVLVFGLYLLTGEQILHIDRSSRRISSAHRVFGRVWQLAARFCRASGAGVISLRYREFQDAESRNGGSYLYYARLNETGRAMDLLFGYSKAEIEEIADTIGKWLELPVQTEWTPW